MTGAVEKKGETGEAGGVTELSRALAAGRISSVELTTALLAGIQGSRELGAFLAINEAASLAQARAADARRARGEIGRAHV